MPGIQTMLPLMLNEVSKKKLKLSKLVDLLCRRPAEIYKMKSRGLIQEGYKASLTVVDLNLTKSLDPKDIMTTHLYHIATYEPLQFIQITI